MLNNSGLLKNISVLVGRESGLQEMGTFFSEIILFLKLNLLGWLWLIRLYRFQVYTSMTHDQHVALCGCHQKSNHLLSSCICLPLPFTVPCSLPSGNQLTVVCVYEFQCYIPHMSEIIWFLSDDNTTWIQNSRQSWWKIFLLWKILRKLYIKTK